MRRHANQRCSQSVRSKWRSRLRTYTDPDVRDEDLDGNRLELIADLLDSPGDDEETA